MQELNQAGVFRGTITEYGLLVQDSGAIALSVRAKIDDAWNHESQGWQDWRGYEVQAAGRLWIVKKDGTINESQAQSLIKHCGWNGDMTVLSEGWEPTPCSFVVNEEKYEGKTSYRISFINDYNRSPGQVGNVDIEEAKKLQSRFGAQFRALSGNISRNAIAPPQNKPKMPKREDPRLD